jgi:hypothetical protein
MDEGTFETLSRVANGDLRKAITTLQSAVRLRGPAVAPATVLDVAGAVPKVRHPSCTAYHTSVGNCLLLREVGHAIVRPAILAISC